MRTALFVLFAAQLLGIEAEAATRVSRPADPDQIVLRVDEPRRGPAITGHSLLESLQIADAMQYRHEFEQAERLLSEALDKEPRARQARLMRAQIRLHLQQPQQALQDCAVLSSQVDTLTAMTCIAQARAQMGDLQRAYDLVVTALRAQQGSNEVRSWSAGVAAELASRLGESQAAGEWYREAYRLNPEDHYARLVYADWLASTRRAP